MSEIDQQFIEYVVKSLVGNPDKVTIERRIDEKGVLLELTVDPEDLGRVIGKRGATAQSLRTLLRALGTKNDARYNLKIIDNGTPPPARTSDNDEAADDHAKPAKKADEPAEDKDEKVEAPEPEAPQAEPQPSEPEDSDSSDDAATSDRIAAAREELADLDDLDI